jgi:hypothetical protein
MTLRDGIRRAQDALDEHGWEGFSPDERAMIEQFSAWVDVEPEELVPPSTPERYGEMLLVAYAKGWKDGRALEGIRSFGRRS